MAVPLSLLERIRDYESKGYTSDEIVQGISAGSLYPEVSAKTKEYQKAGLASEEILTGIKGAEIEQKGQAGFRGFSRGGQPIISDTSANPPDVSGVISSPPPSGVMAAIEPYLPKERVPLSSRVPREPGIYSGDKTFQEKVGGFVVPYYERLVGDKPTTWSPEGVIGPMYEGAEMFAGGKIGGKIINKAVSKIPSSIRILINSVIKDEGAVQEYVPKTAEEMRKLVGDLGIADREIKGGPLSMKSWGPKFAEKPVISENKPFSPDAERLRVVKQADDWPTRWQTVADKKLEPPPKTTLEFQKPAPGAPPEGQLPYAKPPHGLAPERPVAAPFEPGERGLTYPGDIGFAPEPGPARIAGQVSREMPPSALESVSPNLEKNVKGVLGSQSGQATMARGGRRFELAKEAPAAAPREAKWAIDLEEGGVPPAKDLSRLGPDDTVTLYRGAKEPIYGEGGKVDLKLSRWTPDLETAARNAHGGTIYETTVPARDILPMQELFDPKVASPDNLKKGAALAAKYAESAHPQVSASFDPSLSWEPQGLLRGKYDIKVRPSGKPAEIDFGLTGNEPTGWAKRSIAHNASPTESLQKVAAIKDTVSGKVYTGPSHPAIISENSEVLYPLIDAEKASSGWLVEGKFYDSANKALKALRGVSEEGSMRPGVLPLMAGSAGGAATGGVVDQENPIRGAIIGGIVGGAGGWSVSKALMKKVTAGKALPKGILITPRGQVVMPPVHDGNWKNLSLALDPEKAMGGAATEAMIAKGIKRDPSKLMTQQIIGEVAEDPENYKAILAGYGKTHLEFIKDMGESSSEWGRKLGYLGQLAKRMGVEGTPEVRAALSALGHEIGPWDHAQYWWRRVDNVRRGLLVSQLSTAVRNAATQTGRLVVDVADSAMQSALQGIFKAAGGKVSPENLVSPVDSIKGLLYLGRKNKATVDKILSNFPGQESRLTNTYMSDVATGGGFKGVDTAVNIANSANRFQEFIIRRAVFMGKLESRLKGKGLDIATAKAGNVDVADIRYAIDGALDFTFSKNPKFGTVWQKVINAINAVPGATLAIPFPRFVCNSLKFLYEFSPLGIIKLASKGELAAMGAGNMKVLSRVSVGTGMLGAAYAMRASQPEHAKWNEYVREDGSTVDLRPYNPLAAYLFAADLALKYKKGTLLNLSVSDIAEGLLGSTFRAGVGLYTVDAMLNGFTALQSEVKAENFHRAMKEFSGETLAGFLTPLKQIRDGMSGYETFVKGEGVFGNVMAPNKREEPFLGPIKANLPFTEAHPGYDPTGTGPRMNVAPVAKQLTGMAISAPKGPAKEELDRLGFKYNEILPSSGIKEFDNLVANEMQLDVNSYLNKLVATPGWKRLTDLQKGEMMAEELLEIRRDARESVLDDRPDLEEKLEKMRTPRRKLAAELEAEKEAPNG
jgi:hypothetical protein